MADTKNLIKQWREAKKSGDMNRAAELAGAIRSARSQEAQAQPEQGYTGQILPLSRDAEGNVSFDSDAGILGMAKRAFSLPGEVASGEVQMHDPVTGQPNPEGIDRAIEMGGTFTGVNPAVSSGARAIPGALRATRAVKPKSPTTEELLQTGASQLDKAEKMGVTYRPEAFKQRMQESGVMLQREGLLPNVAPKTHKLLETFNVDIPGGATTSMAEVRSIRRNLAKIALERDANGGATADAAAASKLIPRVDAFIENSPKGSVLGGPFREASQLTKEGRGNYAAGKRGTKLENTKELIIDETSSANSGNNLGNKVKQKITRIRNSPKHQLGFTDDELDFMRHDIIRPGKVEGAMRSTANLIGGGPSGGLAGGLASAGGAAAGGHLAGIPGAAAGFVAPMAAGKLLKGRANAIPMNKLDKLISDTKKRSPLYQEAERKLVVVPVSAVKRNALPKATLLSETNPLFREMEEERQRVESLRNRGRRR